jgi:hypothetical protein
MRPINTETTSFTTSAWFYSLLFLLARIILIISVPLEGLKSYGDFWNFSSLAAAGVPFIDLWVEFPPLFPFISRAIFLLVGGREYAYVYLLALLFSLAQAGNIYYFQAIGSKIFPAGEAEKRTLVYAFMLICLFYGWAYFDCLAVFFMLLGLDSYLKRRPVLAGTALAIGGLIKWFPLLLLPCLWRNDRKRSGLKLITVALGIIAVVWIALWLSSPEFTGASLLSQSAKGSWETIWALIDGNLGTGNFNPAIDRTLPGSVSLATGAPPVISPWMTLVVFTGLGLYILLKSSLDDERHLLALATLTVVIFFLWSPGYSPQWVLYLLPLLLLSLPGARAVLLSLSLLLLSLLEWPLILSRGWFGYLDELVISRSLILVLLAVILVQMLVGSRKKSQDGIFEHK